MSTSENSKKLELPPEWDSDESMGYYFAARPTTREEDPEQWDTKASFWRPLIVKALESSGELRFTPTSIRRKLARQDDEAEFLNLLLLELFTKDEVQCVDAVSAAGSQREADILHGNTPTRVLAYLLSPIPKLVSAIVGSMSTPSLPQTHLCLLGLVERRSAALHRDLAAVEPEHGHNDMVFTWPELDQLARSHLELDAGDARLCIDHLRSLGFAVLLPGDKLDDGTSDDEEAAVGKKLEQLGQAIKVFKFAAVGQKQVQLVGGDRTVGVLRHSVTALTKREALCQRQQDSHKDTAKKRLKAGDKARCRQALRMSREYGKRTGQLQTQQLNMLQLLNSLQAARASQSVLSALQQGASSLQQVLRQVGPDEVERVMDDVAEAVSDAEAVDECLSRALRPSEPEEVAELEKELAELMLSMKQEGDLPSQTETTKTTTIESAPVTPRPNTTTTPAQNDSPDKLCLPVT